MAPNDVVLEAGRGNYTWSCESAPHGMPLQKCGAVLQGAGGKVKAFRACWFWMTETNMGQPEWNLMLNIMRGSWCWC
eukprot:252829-Prorocentrum_minimum.AAC.4